MKGDFSTALPQLILAIGTGDFPACFLDACRAAAGADMCSAFAHGGDGPRMIFGVGTDRSTSSFARRASLSYASKYWKADSVIPRRGARISTAGVIRRSWNHISDPAYRRDCYEKGAVIDRASIIGTECGFLVVNLYRKRESGPFSASQLEQIGTQAPVLLAALSRHRDLRAVRGEIPAIDDIAARLAAHNRHGMTVREIEVAAATISGMRQAEIADRLDVSVTSVRTYRGRAYSRLGIADSRELVEFYRRLSVQTATARASYSNSQS